MSNIAEYTRRLRAAGKYAAATLIKSLSVVSIIEWRWCQVEHALSSLHPYLDTLIANFDPRWFATTHQASRLQKVVAAFQSAAWRRQFDFMIDFTKKVGRATRWIGGCWCHSPDGEDAVNPDCFHRGRRLTEAKPFVEDTVADLQTWANSFSLATFKQDLLLFQAASGIVHFAVYLCGVVFHFLSTLPWLTGVF